jgi:hypothetical protein
MTEPSADQIEAALDGLERHAAGDAGVSDDAYDAASALLTEKDDR